LEFAKLVAATYLKQEWDTIKGFNKWYLTSAVALLMLITSAGIFGYLSNAFQAQSLQLQQVDREVLVYTTKIEQNTLQINQLNTQLGQLSSTQSQILDKGKVNSRLLRSIDNKDKQTAQINKKIEILQTENAKNNEEINKIKVKNLGLEKEVGGFRFIAEAFGMELKNVVKFFIFLIVIVFDPLAVALIIAFNGLILQKKKEQKKHIVDIMKNDEKSGLYEVYGDTIFNENEKNEINEKKEDEPIVVDGGVGVSDSNNENETDNTLSLKWEEYMHPEFPWHNKKVWINNPKAVQYWINTKRGSVRELNKLKSEEENIKTY